MEIPFLDLDSDSGIRGPSYQKIVEELNTLQELYPDLAQVITYGRSIEGKPLSLIKISNQTIKTTSAGAIYIGGSIHGNEYLNIEDRLPRWILEVGKNHPGIKQFLNEGGVIYVAPILNPDGYDRRERENNTGIDLNRDYQVILAGVEGFTQPETRSLRDYLESDLNTNKRKLKVAMDYHCCIGALLYPWSFIGPVLPQEAKDNHSKIGVMAQKHLGSRFKFGTTPDILGYSARGTSKDFYYEKFGALSFTLEGRRNEEHQMFNQHTAMWQDIITFANQIK